MRGFGAGNYPGNVSGRESKSSLFEKGCEQNSASSRLATVADRPVELAFISEGHWDETVVGQYAPKADAMRTPALPVYEDIVIHRNVVLEDAQILVLNPRKFGTDTLRLNLEKGT